MEPNLVWTGHSNVAASEPKLASSAQARGFARSEADSVALNEPRAMSHGFTPVTSEAQAEGHEIMRLTVVR